MPVILNVPRHEWESVACLASALTPNNGGFVFLRSDGEHRQWIGSRDDADWLVMGEGDGQAFEVALPPPLIWFAAELAERDGNCELTLVREDLATVESRTGKAVFDLVPDIGPDLERWPTSASRATVSIERFGHLLVACGRSRPSSGTQEDVIWLAVEEQQLAASPHGSGPIATYRVAAPTEGRCTAAVRRSPLLALASVLGRVGGGADDSDLTIDFPASPREPIGVRGDSWGALIPTVDLSVRRWADELEVALRGLGRPVTQAAPEVFHVHDHGRLIRVALHEGPPEVVRLSVVLARGVQPTEDLRGLINRANETLTAVRIWHTEDAELVAAADLFCGDLDSLATTVDVLADQITGLDVLLPALA